MKGPKTLTMKICNECDYINVDKRYNSFNMLCIHPELGTAKFIELNPGGYIQTRAWCPFLNGVEEE